MLIQPYQHWRDSTRRPTAISETGKYRLRRIIRSSSREAPAQLYQKKQLRKLTNFSNLIPSTKSTAIFFSEREKKKKKKAGIPMRNSVFYVKEISAETTFYSNTRAIWRVACLAVTSFSRISVKDISGKMIGS